MKLGTWNWSSKLNNFFIIVIDKVSLAYWYSVGMTILRSNVRFPVVALSFLIDSKHLYKAMIYWVNSCDYSLLEAPWFKLLALLDLIHFICWYANPVQRPHHVIRLCLSQYWKILLSLLAFQGLNGFLPKFFEWFYTQSCLKMDFFYFDQSPRLILLVNSNSMVDNWL